MSAEHLLLTVDDVDDHNHDGGVMKFQIRDLRKVSDAGVPILNGINVGIPEGMIVGIIGPSGSGKSTLLRALNRLWEPPSDTVFLDGRDIVDLDVLGLRRKVGMLFQLPVLFQGTVADNIRYGPNLRGKKLTDVEVSKLLTLADLDSSFLSKTGGELSVGQAQRVALARTLANEPEVACHNPISFSEAQADMFALKLYCNFHVLLNHYLKIISFLDIDISNFSS
ncbi:hypothetical protein ERO13_D10G197100v2 [Gossypium hirsutum]|nr:hypothetical protein ERO13_D10G197100v2 [Gossypium hirsutum]